MTETYFKVENSITIKKYTNLNRALFLQRTNAQFFQRFETPGRYHLQGKTEFCSA